MRADGCLRVHAYTSSYWLHHANEALICYEAFLLCAHPPCVDCTLPHASADISKTDSNRKEGLV